MNLEKFFMYRLPYGIFKLGTCYIRPWNGANARFLDFAKISWNGQNDLKWLFDPQIAFTEP